MHTAPAAESGQGAPSPPALPSRFRSRNAHRSRPSLIHYSYYGPLTYTSALAFGQGHPTAIQANVGPVHSYQSPPLHTKHHPSPSSRALALPLAPGPPTQPHAVKPAMTASPSRPVLPFPLFPNPTPTLPLLLLLLLPALAPALEFTSFPAAVTRGQSYDLTYTPADDTATSIILRKGDPDNLDTVATLTDTASGGKWSWTVDDGLAVEDDYALEIKRGNGDDNYSGTIAVNG